jgi:hypothetical protein
MVCGCGADDDAPAPPQAEPESQCPPLAELIPITAELLDSGQLPGIRRLLGERLEDSQLSSLLDGLLNFMSRLEASELRSLAALGEHQALGPLSESMTTLLNFIGGDPEQPETFRADFIAEVRWLISTCEAYGMLTAISSTLNAPELPRIFDSLRELLKLPSVQEALNGPTPSLNRDGFTTVICNLLASISRPGFSVENDIVQPLVRLNLFETDRPPASDLMRDLGALLAPDRPLLPAFADMVCCDTYGLPVCELVANDQEPLSREPAITWTLHALITAQAIDIGSVLNAISTMAGDPAVRSALAPVARLFDEMIEVESFRNAIGSVLMTVLEEQTARLLLIDLNTIIESGAGRELFDVLGAVSNDCSPQDMSP